MKLSYSAFLFLVLMALNVFSQRQKFTHADSLKGSYGASRSWWDLKFYDLAVRFNLKDSSISGSNKITYSVLQAKKSELQIDLMKPMLIDSILEEGKLCKFRRDGNAFFVSLNREQVLNLVYDLTVYFHGKPMVAKMPPWDGGVVWTKDSLKQDWVSIACQGMAAQVWFPNKDHMADEVDGCSTHFTVPSELIAVSNGKMVELKVNDDGTSTYSWKVENPINNYCIIPYIGKYSTFHDTIVGEGGVLNLDFWVLDQNVKKAREQFKQVKPMLHCFEFWFGKYPFYEDGYKLVEAPFLGMEHQSAIAYGNAFMNGYKGRDLSLTGWGLKWDFIIVHESGHEWFGNSISAKDVADNWIHESFTAYAENLYNEYLFGKKAGSEYVIGTRKSVMNDKPIISPYNVNAGGSIDLYYKGANMLHTIRQIVNNDTLWRKMLRGLNTQFYHQTVESSQIENYMSKVLKIDLTLIFDQYLRNTKIPVLEYKKINTGYSFRYSSVVSGFKMPVKIVLDGKEVWIQPNENWQNVKTKAKSFSVDPNFYVISQKE